MSQTFPFDAEPTEDTWVDPFDAYDEPATPVARADRAYGLASDPAAPPDRLLAVAAELASWDVESLLAEARIHDPDDTADVSPGDRPDVVVLRRLLSHPNRPADLGDAVVRGWLEHPDAPPWCAMVVLADLQLALADELIAAAADRGLRAARLDAAPVWSLLLVALTGVRDTDTVTAMLADAPVSDAFGRWPDAAGAGRGLPGVRTCGRRGAELLGWDGRRLPTAPTILARAVRDDDERRGTVRFVRELELCRHGPVRVAAEVVELPTATRGPKPYVALIVGDHPTFRMKRDWPERETTTDGDVWSWVGPQILELRGLGCDACRQEPDGGKRYLVTDGTEVAPIRASWVHRALELAAGEQAADHDPGVAPGQASRRRRSEVAPAVANNASSAAPPPVAGREP